ncbi:DnaJ family domain-containing protein [Sporosarcina sp. D27]|uniref:DnaJ family domain-containing protein n=1 Tax=Sporosarcina sp. D27 TaxID=1382305 RepID=UPI0004711E25|nr:DnaJ family domain-containing protein [Sporosarcina sp. D27]
MKENNFQEPYNDLMGDIIKKHAEEGGMDNLSGKGKPMSQEYFSGDTFQHFQRIAKDAGYKPHWLNLQQEIREDVHLLAELYAADITIDLEDRIEKINEKVYKYNRLCPRPMQKGPVSLDTIKKVLERRE